MESMTGTPVPHILILEDDTAHQALITRAFSDDPGQFRISVSGTLGEARQVLEHDPPDLIIADWLLPDGNGIEILPRRDGIVAVPLIVMTSHGDECLAVEIMKSGAIDYVVKSSALFQELPHIARRSLRVWESILQRQRAEESYRESESKYRQLVESAQEGIWVIDAEGSTTYVNRRMAEMLGYTVGEMTGRHMFTFMDEPGKESAKKNIELRRQGISSKYDFELIRKDRSRIFASCSATPLFSGSGDFQGVLSLISDITGRKQAEEKLRESEEKFRTVADHSYDWEYWQGPDGRYTYVSPSSERISGYKPGAFFEDPHLLEKIVHPDDRKIMDRHLDMITTGTGPEEFTEFRIITRDGSEVWIAHTCRPIFSSDSTYLGRRGSNRDITRNKLTEKILQEEVAKYHRIYETALEGIWGVDEEFRVIFVNPKMANMLGYPAEEILGHPVTDFIAAEDQDDAEQRFEHRKTGLKEQFERRYIRKDGGIITLIVSASPVLGDDGTFKGSFAMFTDITERKQAEETLRQSENRFRALIQNSSDIIRILDRNGRISYESPSSERLLGYPPGFLIGKDPLDYIHPDDLAIVKEELRNVMHRVNTGIPTEFRIRKADGGYIWVDSLGTNLLDVPGVDGVVITTRPIQQRKLAEQALQESEERVRLALEGAEAAFWDWDLPSGKATFSDRFYTMLEYAPGEFPATYDTWVALMHPDDRDHVLPDLRQQIQEKRPLCEIEYRLLSKNGNWIWILGRGKIVDTDRQGNPVRLTGVNIDITNRQLMESEIRSLNTVLEQRVKDRTEALSKANEALEEENAQRVEAENRLKVSLDEKVMLIKEIHHRVKNNLQIIISLLNLQSRYITDESTLAAIRESQNRVRVMSLVHEKLYQAENVSKIQVQDYIRFLGNSLIQFYGAKSRGVRLVMDIGDVDATINTAIPLGLIVNELISNSLKYAFPGGRTGEITITVTKEGPAMHVQYRDNGVGIPATLDWKNTKSLGLRLVNTLVDQLNGTVELDRRAGTQFTMVLYEKE
jgi:PAS domain S-box-containing protein